MFYNLDENNNVINPSVVYGDKTSDLSYQIYINSPERYYIYDNLTKEIIVNPNFEQEQEAKEQERIAGLNLTGADVERAIYKAFEKDFKDIRTELEVAQIPGLDLKALDIELKANFFYRGNPYINAVGQFLGISAKQLDRFFETNNFEELTREEIPQSA